MHFSVVYFSDKGTQNANKTFDYYNQALNYAVKVIGLVNSKGDDKTAMIRLHLSNHDTKPLNIYSIDSDSVIERLPQLKTWLPSCTKESELVGTLEFQDFSEEYHDFTIVKTKTHLIFGSVCNTGLLESGSYLIDTDLGIDENLGELLQDLESYYNDGKGYQTDRFLCNDRM